MKIGPERKPILRLEDGALIPLHSARVDREDDASYLRDMVPEAGGGLPSLPVGSRIALLSGDSVIFEGRAQEDGSVLDLLSCSPLGDDYEDF